MGQKNLRLVCDAEFDPFARAEGLDWPDEAETMIGLRRLQNLQDCITDVIKNNIEGDLIETGVWRGGATIFMRGTRTVTANQAVEQARSVSVVFERVRETRNDQRDGFSVAASLRPKSP